MNFVRQFLVRPRHLLLRRVLFQVHLWTGLSVGLYIVLIGITGSTLVFRHELEEAFRRVSRTDYPPAPSSLTLAQLQHAAEKAYPGYVATSMNNSPQPDHTIEIFLEGPKETKSIFLDRASGVEVSSQRQTAIAVIEWLADLHFNLLAGRTGRIVNGAGAAFLGLMCLSGIILWWPGIALWRRRIKPNWSAKWKRLNWDLHSAIGFWASSLIAVWAFTGIYFAFPEPCMHAVNYLAPLNVYLPEDLPTLEQAQHLVDLDTLVRTAEASTPGLRTTWINLPSPKSAWARVNREKSAEEHSQELTVVVLDGSTGKIRRINSPNQLSAGDKTLNWFGYLHFGNFGEIPVKLFWVILGLSPPALFVTGSLMWWNRIGSKKWKQLRSAPENSSAKPSIEVSSNIRQNSANVISAAYPQ